ncbi:SCP2 sterol-binding domain-containing protein [Arenibaculum pallidiluteum]|uniref:SCP2 sterol-binding domain-containing protein n=1 Tax=Arenibaculum pallidiluteum TaxID=2812559 RepID=UPI001A96B6F5|nr:SCP2 sterol-binding domain-containing protein [Arenibaculum pallidiluteum]
MTLDQLEAKMKPRLPHFRTFGARARFDFGDQGSLFLDATRTPATLTRGEGTPDTTIRMTLENFDKMISGQLNPTMAFATGRLKVQGSMGLALKLAGLLEDD